VELRREEDVAGRGGQLLRENKAGLVFCILIIYFLIYTSLDSSMSIRKRLDRFLQRTSLNSGP
jgi:hypothetical protein